MSHTSYGGQAVIEGVMMRGKRIWLLLCAGLRKRLS